MVVAEDLELAVEVEVQEDEASEGGSGVARRHGLKRVIDLFLVARADTAVEHDGLEAIGNVAMGSHILGNDGLADGEEVWAETWRLLVHLFSIA